MTYSGKTVLIAGGTSGIGLALAEALSEQGARVIVASSNRAKVDAAAASLACKGGEAHQLDVRDQQAFIALVAESVSKHGPIDYLFNSAGVAVLGEFRDHTDADWADLIDINLRGVIHGIRACYPHMIERGSGHIVNVASIGGLVATPFNSGYAASKFGVVGMSQALRLEASRYGVKVSVVCPAYVETPMAQSARGRHIDVARFLEVLPSRGDTAPECARRVLRGVARNQAMILPHAAGPMALLHRFAPRVTGVLMRHVAATGARLRDDFSADVTRCPTAPHGGART